MFVYGDPSNAVSCLLWSEMNHLLILCLMELAYAHNLSYNDLVFGPAILKYLGIDSQSEQNVRLIGDFEDDFLDLVPVCWWLNFLNFYDDIKLALV